MSSHKSRPKSKKYKKVALFLKKRRNKQKFFRIFSPDLRYLNSKFSTRLEKDFQNNLLEKKKIKAGLQF
jgi:hypothetical protein